jgi:hypothetical protein
MARTFFTNMVYKRKTTSSRFVLPAFSAKKEMVQASRTVIIPNVIGMGSCTGPFLTAHVETETFSAAVTEFKETGVQGRTADLTGMELHMFQVIG